MSFQLSEDCCSPWPKILDAFNWMAPIGYDDILVGYDDILVMPFIESAGGQWRVNYCPSCGADRRGVVISVNELTSAQVGDTVEKKCD